nr:xylulose kinase-1 [Tanacetum cinerariifolium]
MVAYLNKSDASEGFNQVIDFLNGSYIKYALTVNPNIYMSCIKQFWITVVVKQTNDVTRLQALVDWKKVVITEAEIRDVLRLDDTEGVDCLPNKEIFTELARMGYEFKILLMMLLLKELILLFKETMLKNHLYHLLLHLLHYHNHLKIFHQHPRRVEHLEYDKVAQALEISKLKKRTNDVTRLQALVDWKKVVITKAEIRDVLRLDDTEGVDCLPNKEIFTELARMGYEKPSTKLTFYKAFFSSK